MQRESVARVADVIQIPAFLCQQVRTSLSAAYYQATGFLQIWRVLTPFFVSNLLKVNVDLADLLIAAAKTRRVINIKNGQFCASSVSHSIFK
jgi:3-deoxy-D-manno-octulosonic acid (KDO) 8-phosphate synthase